MKGFWGWTTPLALASVFCCGCRGCGDSAPQPATAATTEPAVDVRLVDHGQFEGVHLVKANAALTGTVVLASDAQGWDARADQTAIAMARSGALVVGIDTPAFLNKVAQGAPDCISPAGDFDNLARFAQAYMHLPQYAPAVLVGLGAGASLSVAAQLQVSDHTFAGAIAVDFCDVMPEQLPFCEEEMLSRQGTAPQRFGPKARPAAPIYNLGRSHQQACESGIDSSYTPYVEADSELLSAYTTLAQRAAKWAVRAPQQLDDLPIIEVAAASGAVTGDSFVVLVSGDGGWAGLDRALAERLSRSGVPCVGLDSLRYFWTKRTPDGLAKDLSRIIDYYQLQWRLPKVAVIGFSQGADVVPFAVNRLPPSLRSALTATLVLGPSAHASFEFHVASWVSSDADGLPVMPELRRLAGHDLWCVYGDGDDDALCPLLPETGYHIVRLPGGHHFGGDYEALANIILPAIRAPRASP